MSKLKNILDEKCMTQKELYEQMKSMFITPVPLYMISKIYSGKATTYNVSTLFKICATLMVTPNDILSKEDYKSLFIQDSEAFKSLYE